MSSQIFTITGITGGAPPFSFFICDQNGDNCSYIGDTSGTYTASTFYSTATNFLIKVVDSNDCMLFKTISCPAFTYLLITEDGFVLKTEDGDGIEF
jgi:hypothetical protein